MFLLQFIFTFHHRFCYIILLIQQHNITYQNTVFNNLKYVNNHVHALKITYLIGYIVTLLLALQIDSNVLYRSFMCSSEIK